MPRDPETLPLGAAAPELALDDAESELPPEAAELEPSLEDAVAEGAAVSEPVAEAESLDALDTIAFASPDEIVDVDSLAEALPEALPELERKN